MIIAIEPRFTNHYNVEVVRRKQKVKVIELIPYTTCIKKRTFSVRITERRRIGKRESTPTTTTTVLFTARARVLLLRDRVQCARAVVRVDLV